MLNDNDFSKKRFLILNFHWLHYWLWEGAFVITHYLEFDTFKVVTDVTVGDNYIDDDIMRKVINDQRLIPAIDGLGRYRHVLKNLVPQAGAHSGHSTPSHFPLLYGQGDFFLIISIFGCCSFVHVPLHTPMQHFSYSKLLEIGYIYYTDNYEYQLNTDNVLYIEQCPYHVIYSNIHINNKWFTSCECQQCSHPLGDTYTIYDIMHNLFKDSIREPVIYVLAEFVR